MSRNKLMLLELAPFFILVLPNCSFGESKRYVDCLPYEPAVVQLEGKLKRKTFAYSDEPPPWNQPRPYWVILLSQPVCVGKGDDELAYEGGTNISEVQLVISAEQYEKYKTHLNASVNAHGSLYAGFSAHHFTEVLLSVDRISRNEN